jgi:hypothetical protein
MALTATFKADFSSFLDAVKKADVALADFSKGAGRAEQSLNKMVDNFSGRKLIQDAAIMERAIQEIGGTSKLTAAELQNVGIKASEAVAKMKALGIDVPAGLQKIATESKSATTSLSGMVGTASRLAGMFGIAFGVGAVVGFGKQLLNTADTLTKLHDKTGISVEGLQKFQVAGDDAGNTVEELAKSVNMMQNRLAGGDASAIGALNKMGLSLSELKRLSPDQQFMEIASAIREIQDPAEQVNAAMDVFGRSGAEILPTIKRGFDDLKDASVGMSAEAVKALDETGDAIDRLWRTSKSKLGEVVGNILAARQQFNKQSESRGSLMGLGEGFTGPAERFSPIELAALNAPTRQLTTAMQALGVSEAEAAAISRVLSGEHDRLSSKTKKTDEATRKAAEAQRAFEKATTISLKVYAQEASEFNIAQAGMTKGLIGQKLAALETADAFKGKLVPALDATGGNLKKLDSDLKTGLFGNLKQLPDLIVSSLTGGGGLKGAGMAIGSMLGSTIGSSIGKSISAAASGIGSLAGPIGSALGSLIGPLIGAIANIGGPSKEERETRGKQQGVVDDFRKMGFAGDDFDVIMGAVNKALLGVGKTAEDVRRTVEQLLDTKNPQNFAEAMREVQGALDLQKQSQDALNEAIGRYKFTVEELGPALAGQKLSEQSQQLFKDWQVLAGAGVNVAAIGREMQGSINEFIQSALKTKTEVDPAMRPMLESMAKMGLLTDEAGTKITDLEGHGVTFATTLS